MTPFYLRRTIAEKGGAEGIRDVANRVCENLSSQREVARIYSDHPFVVEQVMASAMVFICEMWAKGPC